MTRRILALAALLTLSATPAVAGLIDEVAVDSSAPVHRVSRTPETKGSGSLVTSETDGSFEAAPEAMRVVSSPESARPQSDRGR